MKQAAMLATTFLLGASLGHALRWHASAAVSANSGEQVAAQDRERIVDLISRYSHAWDSRDSERWTSLFTDDAISQNYLAGKLVSESRSRTERLERATQRHRMFMEKDIQTRHIQTNTLLSMESDGSVSGETLFWVSWQYENEASPRLMHTGVYRDRFVKTPTGWRFARREVRVDHE